MVISAATAVNQFGGLSTLMKFKAKSAIGFDQDPHQC
jgi:hypothetical protein